MPEEIVVEIQDPIVIEVTATPIVVEISESTATPIEIAEPDAALLIHVQSQGIGAHIPTGGIPQSVVTGLEAELLEIRSLIASGSGGNSFLTNTVTDLNSPDYYYYGGNTIDAWKINRFTKSDLVKTVATQSTNPLYLTLEQAWAVRSTLVYTEG